LNYFANQIDVLNFGKALAVKIRCKTNQDMLDLYPQITEALKKALVEKREFELMDEISKIPADRGTPRLVQDLMGVLKEIQTQLSSKGYQNSFIFVDELENSISYSIQEDHLHINDDLVQRRRNRSRGTPQSISQLGSLTRLPGIGFILTLRKNDWRLWEGDIKERVNKIENKYIINIEPLSFEDSKEFLTHRLNDEGFKTSNNCAFVHMGFSDDAIEQIWRKGQGNPRAMLKIANTAFRKSVDKKIRLINPDLVE